MYQARMQPNISGKVLLFGVRMILVKLSSALKDCAKHACSVSHVNVNEGVSNGPNISLEMFDRTGWKEEKLIVVVWQ